MSSFRDNGYISVKQNYNDWWNKPTDQPIMDREEVAYAWIIKAGNPLIDPALVYYPEDYVKQKYEAELAANNNVPSIFSIWQPTEDADGNMVYPLVIDQDYVTPVVEVAIGKLLQFYNKEDDDGLKRDWIRPNLRLNASVKFVEWPMRPQLVENPQIWFYCIVDARAFDNVAEAGLYELKSVNSGDTLHSLVKKYRRFFQNPINNKAAERARIAELLRANGVVIEDLQYTQDIKDWIIKQNEPVFNYDQINANPEYDENGDVWVEEVDPLLRQPPDTHFSQNAQLYLPTENIPVPPSPAHVATIPIGNVEIWIAYLIQLLRLYERQTKLGGKVINGFNFEYQIELLELFETGLRKHLSYNGIEKKYVLNDTIEIFFNDQFKVIYMFLNAAGESIPIIQGLSALPIQAPFSNPRTMAFITHLADIQHVLIIPHDPPQTPVDTPDMDLEQFVSNYIYPKTVVRDITPANPFDKLKKESLSVAEALASKFDAAPFKTQSLLEEEEESLGNPTYATAVNTQAAEQVIFTGDVVVTNLSSIQARIGVSGGGAEAIATAYQLLLNKLSIDNLMKIAITCLKANIPFTCEDIVKTVLGKNLTVGYTVFKSRLRVELQPLAEEALMETPENDPEAFLAILEVKIRAEGSMDFDLVLEEVCALLIEFILAPEKFFKIPTFDFPDSLPTVDIMASISLMLESAIIEMLIGLIMGMVDAVINAILANCGAVVDVFPDIDFGNADMAAAVANRAGRDGDADLAAALAAFFDALRIEDGPGLVDPTDGTGPAGDDTTGTGAAGDTPECPEGMIWNRVTEECQQRSATSNEDSSSDETSMCRGLTLAEKIEMVQSLLRDLSAILTPAEIAGLFNNRSSTPVYEAIIRLIVVRHPCLALTFNNVASLKELFATLAPLVNIGDITNQINHVNTTLGCTFESICEKINRIGDNWPDLGPYLDKILEESNNRKKKLLTDLINDYPGLGTGDGSGTPDDTDGGMPPTFCEEGRGLPGRSLIPKDNASLIFLLEKTVDVMYDATYMAYDEEITKIADSLNVLVSIPKLVSRVVDMDKGIHFKAFNMSKLEEEEVVLPLPDWLPGGKQMTPEFRRLLGTGYIPAIGDEKGKYGPYTTLKANTVETQAAVKTVQANLAASAVFGYGLPLLAVGFLELLNWLGVFKQDVIAPDIRTYDNVPKFAANSIEGLKKIKDIQVIPDYKGGTDGTYTRAINLSISQPVPDDKTLNANFRASSFVMKFTLLPSKTNPDNPSPSDMEVYRNKFALRIGDMPLDISGLTYSQPTDAFGEPLPAATVVTPPLTSAIFRAKFYGATKVPTLAANVIRQLESETGEALTRDGRDPQMDVLVEFVESIFRKGGLDESQVTALNVTGNDPYAGRYTPRFVQYRMFDDMTTQIMHMLGQEILKSPLLMKTPPKKGGTPYIKLVDWAPIPTAEERECGYDPHILALDTMKKRIMEDYRNMIECSPLEDEISVDGLGRVGLSSLEAASMSGCVMTTLRAYALEQLVRAMFPLSVFVGKEVVTKLLVEFITEETLSKMKKKNEAYYEEFLIQVENTFASRMNPWSPYGNIQDVINESSEIGLEWLYAEAAIKEFEGEFTEEEIDEESIEFGIAAGNPTGPEDCGESIPEQEVESLEASLRSSMETQVRSRLRFLVEEQIYSVLVKFQDLICFGETLGFDDNLLARQLPLIHAQKEPGEMRFGQKGMSLETMEIRELERQFTEYTNAWNVWNGARLFNIMGSGIGAIGGLADAVGTTFGCMGEALGNLPNPMPDPPSIEDFHAEIEDWDNLLLDDNVENLQPSYPDEASFDFGQANPMYWAAVAQWEGAGLLDRLLEEAFDTLAPAGMEAVQNIEDSALWAGISAAAAVAGVSVPDLTSYYEDMIENANGTFNVAVDVYNQAVDASADFLSDPLGPLFDIFTDVSDCASDLVDDVAEITIGTLSVIADNPTPFSQFAKGLDAGTVDSTVNVESFGARVKTEEGEGRFDNPIVSTLTNKTGMMMLEKYIKVKSSTIDLSTLGVTPTPKPAVPITDSGQIFTNLPPITMDEMPGNSAAAQAADSYQDFGGSSGGTAFGGFGASVQSEATDINEEDEASFGGAPPPGGMGTARNQGAVVGNNFVMQTFGTYQTEGDPFRATQDGMHNPSLSQILAPREVLNTSRRLAKKPAIDTAPSQIVHASSSPASGPSLPGISTGGLAIPPGIAIAPSAGVNLISNLANISLVPETSPAQERIFNIDRWQEIMDDMIRDNPDVKFSDYFEEWSFGTRLIYVAPTNEFEKVNPDSEIGGDCPHTLKIPSYPGSAGQTFTDIEYLFDEEIVKASDAYMLFERTESEEKLEDHNYKFYNESDAFKSDGVITIEEAEKNQQTLHDMSESDGSIASRIFSQIDNLSVELFPLKEQPFMDPGQFRSFFGSQFNNNIGKATVERAITAIPISSIEVPINLPDADIKLTNLYSAAGLSIDPAPPNTINDGSAFKDFDDLYTRRFMSKTFLLMKNSPGYSLAMKYCLSSDTLLTYSTIYSNLLCELPDTFFDSTKFELKSLFEILMNGGDYAFEGPSEVEKGGNREQAARAAANKGTDGSSRKPSLVDMAIQTPKLIFKGLAEFMDPVIAPSALIVKKAKAGEFFPGMMHEIEGDQSSPWYKLPIELKPYDLPPPIGSIQDPNENITYINEDTSVYTDPPQYDDSPPTHGATDNIRMTTFVPNFIDVSTGESMSPFLRDYFFKFGQQGGNPEGVGTATEQNSAFYMFSKALATFDYMTALRTVIGEYMKAMQHPTIKCKDFMIMKDGKAIVPSPKLDYPGPPIDIPVTSLAMSLLPMDVMMGFGIWPPHTPLGWIYHAIVASEGLDFPTLEEKERIRVQAGIENKKKPANELCINIDQMREEEGNRARENDARKKKNRESTANAASRLLPPGKKPEC